MGKTYRRLDSHRATDRHSRSQMNQALRWVEVRKSRIHRRGVFARRDIPAGTRLIEYIPEWNDRQSDGTVRRSRRHCRIRSGRCWPLLIKGLRRGRLEWRQWVILWVPLWESV